MAGKEQKLIKSAKKTSFRRKKSISSGGVCFLYNRDINLYSGDNSMFKWAKKLFSFGRKPKTPDFKTHDEYMEFKTRNLNPTLLTDRDRAWLEERKRKQAQDALLRSPKKK